jgi:glycerol kinase
MNAMPCILAIDQSTSATKALLLDASGALIDKAAREHRQIYPKPGWVEHDPEEIWRNVIETARQVIDRNRERIDRELLCLSLSNQRETFIVFDRASGKPLHNAIVWQCRRGEPICAALRAAGHEEMVRRKTGLKIDTYFTAPKLCWLIRNEPRIAQKLADGKAVAGTIDTWLIHRLTGGKVVASDHTNASRTLLFDIHELQWDEALCALFEVPVNALPEVRDSTAEFGRSDLGGLLHRSVTIRGVMGDSQASLLAHRCYVPGMAKVTIGTGSSVLLNVGGQFRGAGDGALSTIAWTHNGSPTYCLEGIINYSAATIAWLKDQLGLIRSADETEAAAQSVQDNGGVYLVPAFAGLSAPYWSPLARAAIVGLTADCNRNHIIRAALESIAYQIHDVLQAMRDRAGVDLRTIHADGGATRNRFLMQFLADVTAVEVRVASMPECSPLGAAIAGMVGMGCDSLTQAPTAALPRSTGGGGEATSYHPAMSSVQRDHLLAGWKRAVGQVLTGANMKSAETGA